MKVFFCLLLLIFFQAFVFGQTKIDEYALTDSDSESARIYSFSLELNKQPDSEGLIIIYAGEDLTRAGNLFYFANGVRKQIGYYSKNKVRSSLPRAKSRSLKSSGLFRKAKRSPHISLLILISARSKQDFFTLSIARIVFRQFPSYITGSPILKITRKS